MSREKHVDPTLETLANRQAGMELLSQDPTPITAGLFDLMLIAQHYYINDEVYYADDDDGWDDIRPY